MMLIIKVKLLKTSNKNDENALNNPTGDSINKISYLQNALDALNKIIDVTSYVGLNLESIFLESIKK